MHRLLRWTAVMVVLVGAACPGEAGASDQARRMPVGPPNAGAPSPAVVPLPAAPPVAPAVVSPAAPPVAPAVVSPAAPPVAPAVVSPVYSAPVAPNVLPLQAQAPISNGGAAARGGVKGTQAKAGGHRWRLFHRHSGDEGRPSTKHFFQRRQ
jgi:hypothetical protein